MSYFYNMFFTAAKLIERMDNKVDPCDDFFRFSCGTYLKEKVIPDEKTSITQFSDIDDNLRELLRSLVEKDITENDSTISKMVKHLYQSCMNTGQLFFYLCP